MRNAAGQLPDRFHLLRLPQLGLGVQPQLFGAIASGDVLGHHQHGANAVEIERPYAHVDIEDEAVLPAMPQAAQRSNGAALFSCGAALRPSRTGKSSAT